jgi:hypothetical protein
VQTIVATLPGAGVAFKVGVSADAWLVHVIGQALSNSRRPAKSTGAAL